MRQRPSDDGKGKMPKNWNSYLCNDFSKMELFKYLSGVFAKSVITEEGKVIITTCGENVLQNPSTHGSMNQTEYRLNPCNHEEFDTRVIFHATNAVAQGHKHILIIANDTDIIVIAISFFSSIGAEKLWVSFGMSKRFRYISIHDICKVMPLAKAYALPAFHALTGSDNISFFSGTGKKSAHAQ